MPLIDLQTNLKSLGFGKDRPGEASSNQPYIVTPIPTGSFPTSPDFLLRNGYLNFIDSLTDVERIGKWFIDIKSPSGLLFTAKQELLERQNVDVFDGINRIYNSLGTIAQAGVLSTGYHLNKQGFNVFREGYYTGGKTGYYNTTLEFNNPNNTNTNRLTLLYTLKTEGEESPTTTKKTRIVNAGLSRKDNIALSAAGLVMGLPLLPGVGETGTLIPFTNRRLTLRQQEVLIPASSLYGITGPKDTVNLIKYSGGPGSILGIGKTSIRLQNPLKFQVNPKENLQVAYSGDESNPKSYLVPNNGLRPFINWNYKVSGGASSTFAGVNGAILSDTSLKKLIIPEEEVNSKLNQDLPALSIDPDNNIYTFNSIQTLTSISAGELKDTKFLNVLDFRVKINTDLEKQVLPSTDYSQFNRENLINTGYGPTGYGTSKTTYKGNFIANTGRILNPNQAISADQTELGVTGEDIIDLNFTIDDPNIRAPNRLVDFRAYIENWSDGAKAEWSPIKYMGRAESLYKYNGFSRDVSITFLVPALSRADMVNNYKKLNALMWTVAPSYSPETSGNSVVGLMRGSVTKFTMGDYFNGMPCIIKSVDFSEIEGMGWDINRNEYGKILTPDNEYYTGQLPKGIRVQVSMTPIHNFVPQYGEAFIGWDYNYKSSVYTLPRTGKSFYKTDEKTPHAAGIKPFPFVQVSSANPTETKPSVQANIIDGTAFTPQPE